MDPRKAPPLRGRVAELARLDDAIASTRAGASDIVVFEGPAGIGKSRLLAAACERAASGGTLVLRGAADELDQVTPWGPLLHALTACGQPVLDPADLGAARAMADQRLAIIERMRTALEKASARQPLLIAIDDLQWADAATLLALGVLPGELFSYPVGWLLACRPLPAAPALAGLLARLAAAGASRLHVGPLAPLDAAELAADIAGAGSHEELAGLITSAEGNPFYIIELTRAALRQPDGEATAPAVRAAVATHLRSLSPAARQLLSVASVLGRGFSVAELAEMTGHPASQLLPGLDEALTAEVLAESADQLAFRHDLLRNAVYDGLAASARLALHRDAAGALRRTGASTARIAGHLAIGARPGDPEAVSALAAAARDLLPTSPRPAADLATRALALLGDSPPPGNTDNADNTDNTRHELTLTAVHALVLAGQRAAAVELAEDYLAGHAPPASVEAALQLQLRAAWVFERMQQYPVPLPQRLRTDPAADAPALAAALACDQMGQMWDGAGEQAAAAIEHAMAIVRGSGHAFAFSVISFLQVVNSLLRGRMADALRQAQAGLATAATLEGRPSSGLHEALVADALGANGRHGEALAMLRESLAAAEATGRTYFIVQSRWLRSFQLLQLGRIEDAHAEARAAVDAAGDFGYAEHRWRGLAILAETWLRQGKSERAKAVLGQFGPAAEAGSLTDRHWVAALVADACGDQAGVGGALEHLAAQLGRGCYALAISQHHRLPQLVRIALRAGDVAAAAEFSRAAATLAELNPRVGSLAAAGAHARGLAARDAGLLRDAVRHAAASESPLIEAAAREDLARLVAPHDQRDAIEQLEAAYARYVRAGAHYDTARARAALRTLGVRKRQPGAARPAEGWESLTYSERAVVALVAHGATNREAASELFVSPDTINTHLRHAFAKLGIRSRVELARLAAERGEGEGGEKSRGRSDKNSRDQGMTGGLSRRDARTNLLERSPGCQRASGSSTSSC